MTTISEIPEFHLCAGDRREFAIEVFLPSIHASSFHSVECTSSVLPLTEGFLTIFVQGKNVLRLEVNDCIPERYRTYCNPTGLSMLLEWVFFDYSYLPNGGTILFSEMNFESCPSIEFTLEHGDVRISWDLREDDRHGLRYENPLGNGTIEYQKYLAILCMIVDGLITAFDRRTHILGCQELWHKWLGGYQDLKDDFLKFAANALSQPD